MITTLKTYRVFGTILFTLSLLAFAGLFSIANAEEGFLAKSKEYSPVDPNSIEDLLNHLETAVKGNYDKIETWQGVMEFTSLHRYYGDSVNQALKIREINVEVAPNSCEELAGGTINFKADLKRDMRWVHLNRTKGLILRDAETMQILYGPAAFDSQVIRTPDIIMQATPGQYAKDGSTSKRNVIKVGKRENALDYRAMREFGGYPTRFFNAIGPTWTFLSTFKTMLFHKDTTPKTFRDTVVIGKKSIGDDTEYYIRFGVFNNNNFSDVASFYEILLPSNAGYNPTLIRILEAPDNKPSMEYNISYVKLNGVYLPSNFQETHYNPDGKVTLNGQYILKEQKINKVMTEETFTIKNLGLKNGDKFIDKIEKKEYKYKDANLVFVKDVNEKPIKPNQ